MPTRQRVLELRAHDPSPAVLQLCRDEIAAAKQDGKILTWSPTADGLTGLSVWYRPVSTSKRGSMRLLAASRFNFTQALTCLAVRMLQIPSARSKKQRRLAEGPYCSFFTLFRRFMVLKAEIPPITSSQVLLMEGELKDYLDTQDYIDGDAQDTEDEDFDMNAVAGTSDWRPSTRGLSEEQVATYLSSSSRTSSLSSVGSSSSSGPLPSPACPSGSFSSSPARPSLGHAARPYFSPMVAAKRSSPNYELIATMLEQDDNQFYKTPGGAPSLYGHGPTSRHSPAIPPDTSKRRLADNMQNMTLPHGRAVCDFMSTVDAPVGTLSRGIINTEHLALPGMCVLDPRTYRASLVGILP
ncbi:hypothetical protein B0H13DRAFT_2368093 [Mycena leptocephala]|nr:hypothetical protein B0H13DRAFT_2368093 [Mycena leptocephala]